MKQLKKIPGPNPSLLQRPHKAPRHEKGERFLRGPIPWAWICAATRASRRGSGLKVALAIWHLSGLCGQARTIKLRPSVLREMDVNRYAVSRGLKALEAATLVHVERRDGRAFVVTILDTPADS